MILLDVLNEDGTPTGESMSKVEIHEKGLWHRSAHVWIYNSKGEILFQLRAKDKDSHPGLLDISAAGHVDAGETPDEAAVREMEEEIGHKVDISDLSYLGERIVSKYIKEIGWQNNEIDSIYLILNNCDANNFIFPDGEVEKLEWISIDKLEKDLNDTEASKKYVGHGDYYNLIISEVKKRTMQ